MKTSWLILGSLLILSIFELIPESGAVPYDYGKCEYDSEFW